MALFLASLMAIIVVGLGMALGVLCGRKPMCSGCTKLASLGMTCGPTCMVREPRGQDGGGR